MLAKNYPMESLWKLCTKQAQHIALQRAIFNFSDTFHISFLNFDKVKPRAFSTCHHRRTHYPLEVYVIFLLISQYKTYRTIVSDNKGFLSSIINTVSKYVYGSVGINNLDSDERYWLFANAKEDLTVGFPDRESQQYYGDTQFWYRDGIYAASLYTQEVIYEHAIVEETASCKFINIVIYEIRPPALPPSETRKENACKTKEEYALWRQKYKNEINAFTRDCEKQYKLIVKDLEDKKASCFLQDRNELCELKPSELKTLNKDLLRNKSFPEYYFKKTGFLV